MQPRKDVPDTPVIHASECRRALSLMEKMADNIVERGDVPEELVELAHHLAWSIYEYLEENPVTPEQRIAWATDDKGTEAASGFLGLSYFLPTFTREGLTREDVGAALLHLVEAKANMYDESSR